MKKTLVAILLMAMTLGYAAKSQAEFRWGPRIGINVNKMHFSQDVFEGRNRAGFNLGLQAEYWLPVTGLGLDISLMYAYMDSKIVNELITDNGSASTDIITNQLYKHPAKHFLEIPLNVKYKFGIPVVNRIVAPYVFTGPEVAFKLNGAATFTTSQWVWNIGVGLQFINHLQFSASYGIGMNSAIDGVDLPIVGTVNTANLKARNSYWTITAAWMF